MKSNNSLKISRFNSGPNFISKELLKISDNDYNYYPKGKGFYYPSMLIPGVLFDKPIEKIELDFHYSKKKSNCNNNNNNKEEGFKSQKGFNMAFEYYSSFLPK